MNATLKAALMRGVVGGLIGAGVIFFGSLGTNPGDYYGAGILAFGSLFAYLSTRSAAEGWFDNRSDIQRGADTAKAKGMTPPITVTETTVSETDGAGVSNT